ncbi:hypothetical protein QRX60_44695 [Amycolatopsis mongoliensis]|uniref:Uncharacterized protein n=1 Tax=Amycolatopsis mongoliensis TaxID=715475 RepID=A0A9Y2JLZ0_9PSEU|nr:hypothetical protein [Amycolatopsis sp. 4-36]WIY01061.1 hypothetical protein QRX60_44695 [Amycolatopsis sp. 4-36]
MRTDPEGEAAGFGSLAAVPAAVAGLAALLGVREATWLGEPDPLSFAGFLPLTSALAKLVSDGLRHSTAVPVSDSTALALALARRGDSGRIVGNDHRHTRHRCDNCR